ncbi:RDD family protein [Spirulina sp. CCNP1310]|uniref:RDD family protein n=1 Tax=Spirulina sp. CCNP1310 TaxID=3110249 RepID=UPI002B216749|nr:RDD family protein [Spirulina sp. CCNP1310]MEA5418630.1 RDD family protein [Spirulina sp. CCNP1310]
MKLLNEITLRTPESVELTFTLAGIGNRAYALLIDYLLWSLVLLVFLFFWIAMFDQIEAIATLTTIAAETITLWIAALGLILGFCLYMGYFIAFEVLWQGQTPGKRFVKIRVIRENGRPARLPQATLRSLLRPVDDLFFLGMLLIIFSRREKRLGDWLAGTVVIQEATTPKRQILQISPASAAYAETLPELAQLDRLTPEQFTVLRHYFQRAPKLHRLARIQKSQELATQVQAIIQLPTLPLDDLSEHEFLAAVYQAYQTQMSDRL